MAMAEATISSGWLRARAFDLSFILGTAGLALATAAVIVAKPALFPVVLLADFWLLGYPHVAATFSRLCFDRESFAKHHFLVTALPLLVLVCTWAMNFGVGAWLGISLYFHWQWFHYTRQSWGIAKAYRQRAGLPPDPPSRAWAERATFALVPIWGIMERSAQGPDQLLGLDLRVLPVPQALADLVGILAALALAWWIVDRYRAWREGRLAPIHTLYVLSHHLIFAASYVAISSIDLGWLTLNIWHNLQYLAFVWLAHHRRFQDRIDPAAPFLSRLSRSGNAPLYFLVCLGFAGVVYLGLQNLVWLIPATAVAYQTINFHHYIVDAVIWRRSRQAA